MQTAIFFCIFAPRNVRCGKRTNYRLYIMKENGKMTCGASCASQEVTLAIELFLMENYRFRRNTLNGKVEFAVKSNDEAECDVFRPLTKAALNSIVIRAKREQILEKGSPKTEITEYVESEEVPEYNPVQAFLTNLPEWDGQNHVARFSAVSQASALSS